MDNSKQVNPIRDGWIQIWLFTAKISSAVRNGMLRRMWEDRSLPCITFHVALHYSVSCFPLIILVSETRAWHRHRLWNQCKACYSLQWIQTCTSEVFPWEKLSLGRGGGKVTSTCLGPRVDHSHLVDGLFPPEQAHKLLPTVGAVSGHGHLSSRDHQPTPLGAVKQLRKCSSFSVLSPTADFIEESERLIIKTKS